MRKQELNLWEDCYLCVSRGITVIIKYLQNQRYRDGIDFNTRFISLCDVLLIRNILLINTAVYRNVIAEICMTMTSTDGDRSKSKVDWKLPVFSLPREWPVALYLSPRRYGKVVKCVAISVVSLRRCWKFLCKPILLCKKRQPLRVRTRARVHDKLFISILISKTRTTKWKNAQRKTFVNLKKYSLRKGFVDME